MQPKEESKEESKEEDILDLDFSNKPADEEQLDISLNMNLIPTTRNIFFDEEEEEKSTNPFAAGLEEAERQAEEEEQRRLEELQKANSVPAIVSDNRGNLQTIWKDNMQRWKSGNNQLQEKNNEIRMKKNQNEDIRRQIEQLQSKLGDYQEAIEAKGWYYGKFITSAMHLLEASLSEQPSGQEQAGATCACGL